jgi:hypothetical protein
MSTRHGVTNASAPAPFSPAAEDGDGGLVPVYLTAAVRTSGGPGPGVKRLPRAEAGSLVARRIAVHGDQPPTGYLGAL